MATINEIKQKIQSFSEEIEPSAISPSREADILDDLAEHLGDVEEDVSQQSGDISTLQATVAGQAEELNTLDSESRKNVDTSLVRSFVPKCGVSCGNPSRNVAILKTPYKFTDNYDYIIELGVATTSLKGVFLSLSFWGRNNSTFNYYQPVVNYDRMGVSVPIRLCTDANGYICVALGTDGSPIGTYFTSNPYIFIQNITVRSFGSFPPSVISDDWTFTLADALSEDYSNVFQVSSANSVDAAISELESDISELESDISTIESQISGGNGCVVRGHGYARITPLAHYNINNDNSNSRGIKVKLPLLPTGGVYFLGLRITSLATGSVPNLFEARVYFMRSTNISYSTCYTDPDFPCRIRIANDGDDKLYLLIDGDFPRYSRIILLEYGGLIGSAGPDVPSLRDYMDDFVFSTFVETDLANFTTVVTPVTRVIASKKYVEDTIPQYVNNVNGCVALSSTYARITPLAHYYLNNATSETRNIKVTLPRMTIGNLYYLGIRITTLDSNRACMLSEAKLSFWLMSIDRLDYGECFSDFNFPCRIRIASDEDNLYLLLDGEFPRYSRIILLEHSSVVAANHPDVATFRDYMDDFVFSTFLETDLSNFSAVLTPTVHKTPDIDYVNGLIESIPTSQNTTIPQKFKSFAIFGSSKSTSRNVFSNWIEYYLEGLLGKANLVTSTKKTGTVSYLSASSKIYSFKKVTELKNRINGVGSTLEFSIFGDHVDIVQFIHRTLDYASFDIYDNDVKIGSFDNRNRTMRGSNSMTFTGDGNQKSFVLDDLDSYNFSVTVDGVSKTVSMNPALNDNADCYAVRTIMTFSPYNNGEPRRILYFPTAPGNNSVISVSYDVGHAIGLIQSDYNELSNNSYTNEDKNPVYITSLNSAATYQSGYPLSPIVTNWDSVLRLSFDKYGTHNIKIVITGGSNPYFCFDFACAELNSFMNAAFGGYDLPRVLNEGRWRDWRSIRYLPNFDNLILEYGTNDDRYEIDRVFVREQTCSFEQLRQVRMKDVKYITNVDNTSFNVGLCTGVIESITAFTLVSDDIKTSDIAVGDYVKIGRYHSDWREIAVRKISAVDKVNGTITWLKPFNVSTIWHYDNFTDMVGGEFSVRRLGQVKENYSQVIEKFKSTNPSAKIFLVGMSAFNNNDYCSAWGYDEAFMDIADEYSATFINISDEQVRYNDGALLDLSAYKVDITSTGSADYTVPASSIQNLNRALRILVNGVDVTGKDAYVERTDGWYLAQDATPVNVHLLDTETWSSVTNFATEYNTGDLKIHFYRNIPSLSDSIQLLVGGYGWSNDGVHQVDAGNQVYGSCILKATV